jgi:hypothetical protein
MVFLSDVISTSLHITLPRPPIFLLTDPNRDERVEGRNFLVTSTSQGTDGLDSVLPHGRKKLFKDGLKLK